MKTRDWEWKRRERSSSITTRLGPAVAVLFFNDFGGFREPPKRYFLLSKGIDGLGPFLPVLGELTQTDLFEQTEPPPTSGGFAEARPLAADRRCVSHPAMRNSD